VTALRKGKSNEGIPPTTKVVIGRAGYFVKSLGTQVCTFVTFMQRSNTFCLKPWLCCDNFIFISKVRESEAQDYNSELKVEVIDFEAV
jgi:hypothetical protein